MASLCGVMPELPAIGIGGSGKVSVAGMKL
jgi:hypothetical protein